MRRSNRARLGRCLPILALLGLVGCEDYRSSDGQYGGHDNRPYAYPSWGYANRPYAYQYGGYGNRPYAYPPSGYGYGNKPYAHPPRGYGKGSWGRDRDDRKRYAKDGKEQRYERLKDNGRPGDAQRFNNRLCRNGIPGDAPAGC